jgi:hypothetical protein
MKTIPVRSSFAVPTTMDICGKSNEESVGTASEH